jgi:hypothetical protein
MFLKIIIKGTRFPNKMTHIVYSATSLESFMKRKVDKGNDIYYLKSNHHGERFEDISYTDNFYVSTERAMRREWNKKTPLVMTLEADKSNGRLSGNMMHLVFELWLSKNHLPESNTTTQKYDFIMYNPKQLMRIMENYIINEGVFVPNKTTFINE